MAGVALVVGAPSGQAAAVGGLYAAALAGMLRLERALPPRRVAPLVGPWMRRLDHSMIFVLIAATYTPVLVLGLDGVLRR